MALLSIVMADTPWDADATASPAETPRPLAPARDDRLTAIVDAIDTFGVAVERKASPARLVEMLLAIREQLGAHNTFEQHRVANDATALRALRDAHEQL